MPNWCITNITINYEDNEKLKAFHNLIEEWTSHDYKENGFGHDWLGNIVGNSGIGTINEGKDTDLRCRGVLNYIELSDNQLLIQTETAWVPMLQMWVKLLEKYLPEAELIYNSEELGCEILATNDLSYIDKYYIDTWDIENMESDYCASKSETIKFLQELLNTEKNNINELLKLLRGSDFNDKVYICKWDFSEVNSWE